MVESHTGSPTGNGSQSSATQVARGTRTALAKGGQTVASTKSPTSQSLSADEPTATPTQNSDVSGGLSSNLTLPSCLLNNGLETAVFTGTFNSSNQLVSYSYYIKDPNNNYVVGPNRDWQITIGI